MKSPLNSKGQMVLLLDPNDPQQCAYTDTTVASWLQTCAGGRRIHDLCFQNTSQSCLGRGGIPPLAIDAFKKHFCYPLETKIVSKASRERTWVGGVNSGRTVPGSLGWIPADGHAAGSRFCPETRALSQVPVLYLPLCAGRGRERLDSNRLKL